MKTLFILVCSALLLFSPMYSQISAKLMRYMDVSDTQNTSVYGCDIWVMHKTGGTAVQVTHSFGEESWPRLSPYSLTASTSSPCVAPSLWPAPWPCWPLSSWLAACSTGG